MTNRSAGILAACLIALGTASGVALAFELDGRPAVGMLKIEARALTPELATDVRLASSEAAGSGVIELAPVVVVGVRHRTLLASPISQELPQQLCSMWRSLAQGPEGASVRVCE